MDIFAGHSGAGGYKQRKMEWYTQHVGQMFGEQELITATTMRVLPLITWRLLNWNLAEIWWKLQRFKCIIGLWTLSCRFFSTEQPLATQFKAEDTKTQKPTAAEAPVKKCPRAPIHGKILDQLRGHVTRGFLQKAFEAFIIPQNNSTAAIWQTR